MMMSLGMFQFEIGTLPYQQLSRDTSWRHGRTDRFGARQASQYLGPGDDKLSLSGALVPGLAGTFSALDTLRQMADEGEGYSLVDGQGNVIGAFVIDKIGDNRSVFLVDGLARKGDFTLELTRIPQSEAGSGNLLSSALPSADAQSLTLAGAVLPASIPTVDQLLGSALPGADLVRSLASTIQGALPIAQALVSAFPLQLTPAALAEQLGLPASTASLTGTIDKLVGGGIVAQSAQGLRIVEGLMIDG